MCKAEKWPCAAQPSKGDLRPRGECRQVVAPADSLPGKFPLRGCAQNLSSCSTGTIHTVHTTRRHGTACLNKLTGSALHELGAVCAATVWATSLRIQDDFQTTGTEAAVQEVELCSRLRDLARAGLHACRSRQVAMAACSPTAQAHACGLVMYPR